MDGGHSQHLRCVIAFGAMLYLAVKALLSGLIVAAASEAAKSNFLLGALILSLPIVSVLAFVWLWRDTADNDAIATLALSTFWFVLASLPLFPILWVMLKSGFGFWPALGTACASTMLLYIATSWALGKVGFTL